MADVRVERVGDVDVAHVVTAAERGIGARDHQAARGRRAHRLLEFVVALEAQRITNPRPIDGDDMMGGGNGPKPTAVQPRLTPAADALLRCGHGESDWDPPATTAWP